MIKLHINKFSGFGNFPHNINMCASLILYVKTDNEPNISHLAEECVLLKTKETCFQ